MTPAPLEWEDSPGRAELLKIENTQEFRTLRGLRREQFSRVPRHGSDHLVSEDRMRSEGTQARVHPGIGRQHIGDMLAIQNKRNQERSPLPRCCYFRRTKPSRANIVNRPLSCVPAHTRKTQHGFRPIVFLRIGSICYHLAKYRTKN